MFKAQKINWFYATLILFMVSLPFSEALISISGVLLLLASFFHRKRRSELLSLTQQKEFLLFSSIYLVYLLGLLFTVDQKWALYDLQKNIPFLIIPLSFMMAKPLSKEQLINLLKVFVVAVSLSALTTMLGFYLNNEASVLRAQEFGFIDHIRMSMQVVLSLIILSVYLHVNWTREKGWLKPTVFAMMLFLFLFLLWHQSLTGLLSFLGTTVIGLLLLLFQLKNRVRQRVVLVLLLAVILLPAAYMYYAVNRYYDVDPVVYEELETTTRNGNSYQHDLDDQRLENGHYVGLYWSEQEMKAAWNARASLKYDDHDQHGHRVKQTLARYLTSKNLRKDADGVNQLSKADIGNIEAGISNYLLARKGLSLYPRVYVSIWELDTYLKTGHANHKSLAQRIEYTKAALTIIRGHFWFGVGAGDWKQAYHDAYQEIQSQMDPAQYADAHNQYLNYMVKFGLVGLVWILFAIGYPLVSTKSYRQPIFFLFLVSLLLANLGDSNFETHVGGSFFVLFYCLFIASGKDAEYFGAVSKSLNGDCK
ncbi:O-antigen ligase family protein [uncultured Sunxiuqinia sp.]|uniref:O-antigen ligase family protein n=1 Tax=uncultured Sunxiuqinia sp. TaxID=1573825 RepID=UPI0030D78EDE